MGREDPSDPLLTLNDRLQNYTIQQCMVATEEPESVQYGIEERCDAIPRHGAMHVRQLEYQADATRQRGCCDDRFVLDGCLTSQLSLLPIILSHCSLRVVESMARGDYGGGSGAPRRAPGGGRCPPRRKGGKLPKAWREVRKSFCSSYTTACDKRPQQGDRV